MPDEAQTLLHALAARAHHAHTDANPNMRTRADTLIQFLGDLGKMTITHKLLTSRQTRYCIQAKTTH
eukprot:6199537-Pleurochrysis_carterae.AAC.2